jgi:hypothetical protein
LVWESALPVTRINTERIHNVKSKTFIVPLLLLSSALFVGAAFAADSSGEPGLGSGKKNPLNNVYFGEQHLHTSRYAHLSTRAMADAAGTASDAISAALRRGV